MADTDVTPDTLMAQFKGKSLRPILVFTVIVHVVVIIGSSVPFMVRSVFGQDNAKLSEDERIKSAVEDATAALQKIADKHGLNPQDVSSQFGGGASRTAQARSGGSDAPDVSSTGPAEGSDAGKSAYETNLEAKADGPTVPTFDDESDDIF